MTATNGYDQCLFYASLGAGALGLATGREYEAVSGRSVITLDFPGVASFRHANGGSMVQTSVMPPRSKSSKDRVEYVNHAWIELDSRAGKEFVDFSMLPATWHLGALPAGNIKVREPAQDRFLSNLQKEFERESLHAVWLALPSIVAGIDYDELKRLLERLTPHDERLTRRAFAYWQAANAL